MQMLEELPRHITGLLSNLDAAVTKGRGRQPKTTGWTEAKDQQSCAEG